MLDQIRADLAIIRERDPAARGWMEMLFCYPGLHAISLHRFSHRLWRSRLPLKLLARCISQVGRGLTGIEIHPGARIGTSVFIDHGMGVVIGETAEIGDNVTIYQCVTLGGTNPTNGKGGKRHPTISDEVIIGSGAQVIGPITVGRRARIGANAVVTDEVPEGATMIGLKARSTLVPAEEWVKEFIPYGTPCDDPCEPSRDCIEKLETEMKSLRAEIDALRAEAEPARRSGTED